MPELSALLLEVNAIACCIERPRCRSHEQHRFAQLAVAGIELDCTARFRIGQDGIDHGFHIAAHALTVVVEHGGNAAYIVGRRVTGHQLLDELLADEGTDVGMHEDIVDCIGEIRLDRLPRRQRHSVEQGLRALVVVRVDRNHVAEEILRIVLACRNSGEHRVGPAREHVRESLYRVALIIGRYRRAASIENQRTVLVQLRNPDREQLHDLSRVVLVWTDAVGRLVVVDHVQIVAHYRRQRHLGEDVLVVAEGVVEKYLLVLRHPVRQVDVSARRHQDLR